MPIGNTGVSPSYKVPRYIAKILMAAGAVSSASQRLKCLLIGKKTSAGSMAVDAVPIRITDADELDAKSGPGSQLAMMGYVALTVPSIELWVSAITEPGAGTQATATIVISGAWTTSGLLRFRIAGIDITVSVTATMIVDDVGTAITTAFNAKLRQPVTAAYNAGSDTVTLTTKNKGVNEKDWILYYVADDAPSGIALAITGSAAVNTNGVRLGAAASGTGNEDATTLITKLQKTRYARIGLGHNDATNAALWETMVNTKAGPLSLLLDQLVFGHNGTTSQAISLAQTTLNAFRAQVLLHRNSENHPAQLAAYVAALRSVFEQTNPIYDWDSYPLEAIRGQAFEDDYLSDTEQDTLLNAGVTPVSTVDGVSKLVRMITTYCQSGGVQDERCLDIGDPTMTDYATLDIKLMYETEFRPQNPVVRPDPAPEEEPPTAGIAYPKLWNSKVQERLETYYANGWLSERPVGKWAPVSDFYKPGGYIVTDTPLAVQRLQHRLDNVMRQIATVG
jgi:phage tail sheath gpL-like